MVWSAILPAAVSLFGARSAGRSAERAANTSAQAQLEAARIAAEEARFRPVGITSRFGQSNFVIDPETGRLTSAGYDVAPDIAALREGLLGGAGGALGQAQGLDLSQLSEAAQGLFGMGSGYLAESPEAARQRYMEQQQALLDPIRQREEERLASSVFGRGRAGLSVGDMGQPELFSLASARRMQDLELGRQAEQAAQQQIGFGAGLFGMGSSLLGQIPQLQTAAFSPFQTQLGLAQQLEAMGQQPLSMGAELGGGNVASAQALLQGGMGAAQTGLQGSLASSGIRYGALQDLLGNQQLMSGIGGLFGSGSRLPAPITGVSSAGIPGLGQGPGQSFMMPSATIYPVPGWAGTSTPLGYSYYGT